MTTSHFSSNRRAARKQATLGPSRAALALASVLVASSVAARDVQELDLGGGRVVRYFLVLPNDFDPDETYPGLLALPPRDQDERMANAALLRFWGDAAAEKGWIVVAPIAPDPLHFHEDGARDLQGLADVLSARYRLEGGKFHLAGSQTGGTVAFALALEHPESFLSLSVLPGSPRSADDLPALRGLSSMPVRMYVGRDDTRAVQLTRAMERLLARLGVDVRVQVSDGESYRLPDLGHGRFMDEMDALRDVVAARGGRSPGGVDGSSLDEALDALTRAADALSTGETAEAPADSSPPDPGAPAAADGPDAEAGVEALLDRLHVASALADGPAYFEQFAPEAEILGAEGTRRRSLAAHREAEAARFAAGEGVASLPLERHVWVAPDGEAAWFDELLRSDRLGTYRATGLAVRSPDGWRIVRLAVGKPDVRRSAGQAHSSLVPEE